MTQDCHKKYPVVTLCIQLTLEQLGVGGGSGADGHTPFPHSCTVENLPMT